MANQPFGGTAVPSLDPRTTPAWQELERLAGHYAHQFDLRQAFATEPKRFQQHNVRAAHMLAKDMRDDFFIDYVDIEWGLRAKTLGFQSFGVCGAMMAHDLGDEPIEFFGKRYPLHSPLRHYYHFRNAVWMYRRGWLPIQWRLVDGWRLLLKLGFYTLFAKPRLQRLKMMTRGVVHGLIGRMGRLN